MSWRIPRFTTLQLLLAAALCALLLGLGTASWRATDFAQVTAVAFSPRGQYLAAQYESGAIRVWSMSKGRPSQISQVEGVRTGWYATGGICFADEHCLVTARPRDSEDEYAIYAIDVPSGKMQPLQRAATDVEGTYEAAGGRVAVLHPTTGTIRVYDVASRNLLSECQIGTYAWGLSMSDNGKSLVVLDQLGGATVFETETSHPRFRMPPSELVVAVHDGNQSLAYASPETIGIARTDLPSSTSRQLSQLRIDFPTWLDFSEDGSRLVVADPQRAVILHAATLNEIGRLEFPHEPQLLPFQPIRARSTQGPSDFDLSPDGQLLATFQGDRVLVWDATSSKLRHMIRDSSLTVQVGLFTLLFASWSAAWGIVVRRNAERERQAAESGRLLSISALGSGATTLDRFSTATLPPSNPPIEIELSWGLMVIGGLVAMALPIYFFVHAGPLQWPMMYVSLFTGIAATGKGAGRQTTGLLWVTRGQLLNLLACDPINFVLGTLAFALLKRPHVRQYLALVNDLARSLR